MLLTRRNILQLVAVASLSGCWVFDRNRRIIVLAEDVPGTRAIRDVAVETMGASPDQFVLDPYEQMTMKANTDFSSRTGSYDVVLQYNAALANYVQNDYIIPLSELEEEHTWLGQLSSLLFDKAWKEVGWYGTEQVQTPFGVPFSANSMLLCCNRAMFEDSSNKSRYGRLFREELEPPQTWDQFERVAQFFATDSTRGVALHGAGLWNYYEWTNLAFGSGGGVMAKPFGWISDLNTPLLLSSPATVAATERYVRLKPYSQFGRRNAKAATAGVANATLLRTSRTLLGTGATLKERHPGIGNFAL